MKVLRVSNSTKLFNNPKLVFLPFLENNMQTKLFSCCSNYIIVVNQNNEIHVLGKCQIFKNKHGLWNNNDVLLKIYKNEDPIIKICCSTNLIMCATLQTTLIVAGGPFGESFLTYETENTVDLLCASQNMVAYSSSHTLTVLPSPKDMEIKYQCESNIVGISSHRDVFFVLFESGELCSTKPILSRFLYDYERKDSLYNVQALIGVFVIYSVSSYGFLLAITNNNTAVLINIESNASLPIQIPLDSGFDTIIYGSLSPNELFLFTINGNIHHFSIKELFAPDWVGMKNDSKWIHNYPIQDLLSTNQDIYVVIGEFYPRKVALKPEIMNLVDRKSSFMILHNNFLIDIDPKRWENVGFCSGDIVYYMHSHMVYLGGTSKSMYLQSITSNRIIEIEHISDMINTMLCLPLIWRRGSLIKSFALTENASLQVDTSPSEMLKISPFLSDDLIHHPLYGNGNVLGVRANSLVIRFKHKTVFAQSETPSNLIKSLSLIEREGKQVFLDTNINKTAVLIEKRGIEGFDCLNIVCHSEFGIGVFLGCLNNSLAIRFVKDSGYVRMIQSFEFLNHLRTQSENVVTMKSIRNDMIDVDLDESKCQKLGCIPYDYIEHNGIYALCLGSTIIDNETKLVFQTEDMILSNIGVGIMNLDPLNTRIIARLSSHGTRLIFDSNGKEVQISINTDDFLRYDLLPLDLIKIDDAIAMVIGINEYGIWVQWENYEYASILNQTNYELIYRRYDRNVFGKTIETISSSLLIDMMSYKAKWFRPGDIVKQDDHEFIIISCINNQDFLVRFANKSLVICTVNPFGFLAGTLIHRPFRL